MRANSVSSSLRERRSRGRGRRPVAATVTRKRLVSRLAGAQTPVILIAAPAGFGKSTVLAEWGASDARPFASVRLGDRHDDPVLLTASIAGALGDLFPVDEGVYAALHGSRPATLKVAIPRLLESLERSSEPMVLALDDLHALRDPESLKIVGALTEGLPDGSQLALLSRSEPSIRLGRLRANRALTELNAADLAMTEGEAARLLRACGLRLASDTVEVLVDRTEGWPAALYLAALSLRSADDPDDAARRFAGDDRVVVDYLRDEFVSGLTRRQLAFLSRTSILDELDGEVCDAVLETEGSAEVLRGLGRANALVSPLDQKDRCFRYHALLRDMLASELHRLKPREEAELHARAAHWYAGKRDFDRAVPHAIASGDIESSGRLIWSQTAAYTSAGREATLQRWLAGFTEGQLEASPYLCLVRATYGLSTGNGAEVTHWTERALATLGGGDEDEDAIRVASGVIRAAGAARDGVVQMRADAAIAFEALPEDDPWRSICRLVEGASLQLTGDPQAARTALEDGIRRGLVGAPSVHAICLSQLALLAIDEGDLSEAGRLSDEAVSRSEVNALADQPTQALVPAVAALVEARKGEAARASDHVRRAVSLLVALIEVSPWYEAETRIVVARALARLDDVAGAREQLAEAGRKLRKTPDAPLLREWLEQAWKEADSSTISGRWPLSPAELRLLHFLPTHLSFREIADELFVSANTVKTQARSVYRKLGVSSRAEAVACARGAGLLGEGEANGPDAAVGLGSIA